MKVFVNGVCGLLAFINVGIALWTHDTNQVFSWASATLGWFLATAYAYELEEAK